MRPTKLLIFGNPKGGTPLMIASPSIAIDLPLKILIAEDESGKGFGSVLQFAPVWFSRGATTPSEAELVGNIAVVEALAAQAAE